MSYTPRNLFDKFVRNQKGDIAVLQFPNIPLIGWVAFSLLAMLVKHGKLHAGFHLTARALLFVWSYNELRYGDSLFRKALGALVLLATILSFYR